MDNLGEIEMIAPEPCPQCGQTMDCHAPGCKFTEQRQQVFNRTWFVEAAWAHPIWQHYCIILVDVTTKIDGFEPVKVSDDMTHEISVWALLPDLNDQYPEGPVSEEDIPKFKQHPFLAPPNHVYQFTVSNHEKAERIGSTIYKGIRRRFTNPDTDARSQWDSMIINGVKMHRLTSEHRKDADANKA